MSDDEYYDDEYADFHDMLYDADPDPDLADDLAEHAAYSPVWFDHPNEETREYFSDWEYYSDDYFDDDPVLLSTSLQNTADGALTSQPVRQPAKRGRKRKLLEAREHVPLDTKEMKALKACIRGTVWKSGSPEPASTFKRGLAEPVALRLNKAIMKSAYSTKQGFGMGGMSRDESWANDLSLADMGLRAETSMDIQHGGDVVEGDDGEAEDESIEEDEDAMELADDPGVNAQGNETDAQLSAPLSLSSRPRSSRRAAVNARVQDSDDEGRSPKRRRTTVVSESSTEGKNTPNTPDTSLSSDISVTATSNDPTEPKTEAKTSPERSRRAAKKHSAIAQEESQQSAAKGGATTTSRKRKISSVETSATASTASSRAKKVATSKAVSSSDATSNSGTRKLRSSASRGQ